MNDQEPGAVQPTSPPAPASELAIVRTELGSVEAELARMEEPASAPTPPPRTAFVLASGEVVRIPEEAVPSEIPQGARLASAADLEIAWPNVAERDAL